MDLSARAADPAPGCGVEPSPPPSVTAPSPHRAMKKLLALLLVAAAPFVAPVVSPLAAQEGIKTGARGPAAAVETLDGKPASLGSYVGTGPVLIEFWATWCGNCKELEPAMAAAQKKYAGKVRFVTVAVGVNQSPERVRRHAAAHAVPGTLYYDKTGAASDAYDVPATSYVVVLDRTGKVVYTGVGGTQNIDAAVRKAL